MFRLIGSLLLIPLTLTSCLYGPDRQTSQAIDPPPKEVEQAYQQATQKASKKNQQEAKKTSGYELYFLSDTGHVVPYTIQIPNVKGIAKETIEYMVKGSAGEKLIPQGFQGILSKGTRVKGLDIQKGTATVDFSKEFLKYKPDMEEKILSAITWTLTGFPSVEKVNIRVDGKTLETMPHQKSVAQGLTRDQGINLEVTEGIQISQSIPVTLYFMGQTSENQIYYVPVTRMINRTENVAEAAMKELIKGPKSNSGLVGALDSSLQVNQIKIDKQNVTADFSEQLLQYNNQKKVSQDALRTILFSLSENTSAKKITITVNGKKLETDPPQPTTRPKRINPIGL